MSDSEAYRAAGCTSYKTDIRPKFTTEDVDHMNDLGMDLNDYSAVKDNADLILSRLKDTDSPMPPRPRGPWSPEWIKCFEQWIASGKLP
jgi:hypothetical protein